MQKVYFVTSVPPGIVLDAEKVKPGVFQLVSATEMASRP